MSDIEQQFSELLQLSAAKRERRLEELAAESPELNSYLVALLQAHDQAGSFLQAAGESTAEFDGAEQIGKQIRQYKLREIIGEGGMGVVYVAEQEKPLRRKVALKVIKPGMDSKAVLARFDAERQALALMSHPNIARVLDAGTTAEGRPYFVMELVSGQPITKYCDAQKLAIRERLDLFTEVCQAIQHAHQKGIIHRDIKPSNVLVTELDGKPVAKVIDFGVAKALNQSLTEQSIYTAHQAVIGTPLYMSPEQASFSAVDVDTRSDVYSLGVLLYELLTGTTPFSHDDLKQAAQDEVFKLIREQEPPRPSNRISSLGESATEISSLRRTQPDQLGRTVKGDLDWIVMKALSKERGRRYDSANGLSQDILRLLRDEPVEATPESSLYILQKFYRRNQTLVRASLLMAALLTIGLTIVAKQNRDLRISIDETNKLSNEREAFVVQRTLLRALEGDLAGVQHDVTQYPAILEKGGWSAILESAALMHQGKYQKATEKINSIDLSRNSNNVILVHAILTLSYIHSGNWEKGIEYGNLLRTEEPRAGDYADIDQLFLGYGLIFIENGKAARLLREVLDRNPTWLAAQAILADCLVHRGNWFGDDALIDEAYQKSSAVVALLKENPFALDAALFANQAIIARRKISNQPYDELTLQAELLIQRLEKYREHFILATAMPAQYYDVVGDSTNAEMLWEELLKKQSQLWRWLAIGRLYWSHTTQEMLRKLGTLQGVDGQLWIQAARGYLLADSPGGKEEAIGIFNALVNSPELKPGDYFFVIQIPLLLGEKDLAIKTAQNWVDEWSGSQDSEYSDFEMIKIIASDGEYSPEQESKLVGVLTQHMRGLLAISDGDNERAYAHFEAASLQPWRGTEYNWSIAFRDRCKNGKWPSENPNVTGTPE